MCFKLVEIPCNLCGSKEFSVWAKKDSFKIVRCKDCGLIFVNPRLSKKEITVVYRKLYFNKHTQKDLLRMRLKMYEREIAEIERFRSGGKILDVGCGEGYMLSLFGNHWQKYGTEINHVSAEFAKKHFNLNIKIGQLTLAHFPDNYFDVISMRGVIEHLTDPLFEVNEAARILKPAGILAINTPNIESIAAKVYKENFRLIDPKLHLYYFSPKTLTLMLQKAGLKIVETRYFYLGTPYAVPFLDSAKIFLTILKRFLRIKNNSISPAFFGSVINLYATKP